MNEVVVTGAGLLHPSAADLRQLAAALARGTPPASPEIAGFDYRRWFADDRRAAKMDRLGRHACVAALLALRDAALDPLPDRPRVGLVAGTLFGGLEACLSFHSELLAYGPNPATFPNTAHNVAAGQVAIRLGVQGPVMTIVGPAAGLDAVVAGARWIAAGRADVVLAGGFDRWLPEIGTALASLGLLGAARNGDAPLVPAEAACFVVLESAAHAAGRGAPVLGLLRGWGQAAEALAGGGVRAGGGALTTAMRRALAMARVEVPTALCVASRETASYDAAVAAACGAVSDGAVPPPKLEPKRALGETFGAAGPLALVSALVRAAAGEALGDAVLLDGVAWKGGATALVLDCRSVPPPAPSSAPRAAASGGTTAPPRSG